jgi:hypothetical protein
MAMEGLILPSLEDAWKWLAAQPVQPEGPQLQRPIPPRPHGPNHQSRTRPGVSPAHQG